MESVDFYKEFGELGYLANYSNHGFYDQGVFYKTVEHYYQAHKFDNSDIQKKIINSETPKEASNIGRDRNHIRISNIDEIKNSIMFHGLYLKFSEHINIRNKLLYTGHKNIREMTVKEYYWGVGDTLDGQNNIGKILCNVREVIREEILTNILIEAKKCKKVYLVGEDKDVLFLQTILNSLHITNETWNEEMDVENKKFILLEKNNCIPQENIIGIFSILEPNDERYIIAMPSTSMKDLIVDVFQSRYSF